MSVAHLRLQAFEEHLRALNELVRAVEALEAPPLPDVPAWPKYDNETNWQALAIKLHDALEEATEPDAWGDIENVFANLQAIAERAREALLALNAYQPPYPPGA